MPDEPRNVGNGSRPVNRGREVSRITARDVIQGRSSNKLPERYQDLKEYYELTATAQRVVSNLVQLGSGEINTFRREAVEDMRQLAQEMQETTEYMAQMQLTDQQRRALYRGFDRLDDQYIDAVLDLVDAGTNRITMMSAQDPLAYRRERKQRLFKFLFGE